MTKIERKGLTLTRATRRNPATSERLLDARGPGAVGPTPRPPVDTFARCSRQIRRRASRLRGVAVLLLALGAPALLAVPDVADAATPPTATPAAIRIALAPHLLPGEVVIGAKRETLASSGEQLIRAKVLDPPTMRVREVVLDERKGTARAYEKALAADAAAWRGLHGASDAELADALDRADGHQRLRVAVGFAVQATDALRSEVDRLGMTVDREAGGYLEVSGRVADLHTLARSPLVEVMVLASSRARGTLALSMAKDLGQPAIAGAHQLGVGTGYVSAVWEPEACIKRSHPDFQSVAWLARPGGSQCDARGGHFGGTYGHSTLVAGALTADRGANGTVGLYRAKLVDVDDQNPAAVDAMWALNPHIVNASFTILPTDGQRIDREVYQRGSFVFNGSGNDSVDAANCYAYNALCVGGYRDEGTVGTFTDDQVSSGASYKNVNGREGPQLVGPMSIRKLPRYGGSGYEVGSGTSFATPAVAGTAGLLLATHPFTVFRRPSLLRAVLMASAQAHPVKDANPGSPGRRIPNFSDGYDDRAGAGAPNGDRADAILRNKTFFFDKAFEPADLGSVVPMSANAGERVRVVMSWDQCPGYSATTPRLNADFDMVVSGPRVNLMTPRWSNLSDADNFEIVEFVAPTTGTYNVNVSAPTWQTCAQESGRQRARLALAWTREKTQPMVFQP